MFARRIHWSVFLILPVYRQDKNLSIVLVAKSGDHIFWKVIRDGVEKSNGETRSVTLASATL